MGSKPLVRPPKLVPGSRIALVAPAGPLLERDDLTRAEALCGALGYEPVLGNNAYARYGYLAGSDEARLADLNSALRDDSIDAVWCIRGGYGSTRILDRIDYNEIARRPKALIGFSDITALLNAVIRLLGPACPSSHDVTSNAFLRRPMLPAALDVCRNQPDY
jgi:muramoyltetrapeptide carboxypeptidase